MNNKIKYLFIGVALSALAVSKKTTVSAFKINGFAQGTSYAINYYAEDSVVSKMQIDSILNVIDLSMSLYKSNSAISKFNQMPSGKMKLDNHMKAVVAKSFLINKETNGLFDITLQPLMRLWGFFDHQQRSSPDTSRIKALLKAAVGMDKIKLKKDFLNKKNNPVEIDLNGIAQGYTVDVIVDFLESKAIKSYLVELGGEIRAKGPKPDGTALKIGIEGPTANAEEDGQIKHIIAIRQGAVTTSGNYRKFISYKGKNYGHLIYPKTGYPVNNEVISVTVFANRAIDADGYDNALMLMGVEKAMKFVAQKKGLEVYIIYKKRDGKVADTLTSGFKKMILK